MKIIEVINNGNEEEIMKKEMKESNESNENNRRREIMNVEEK